MTTSPTSGTAATSGAPEPAAVDEHTTATAASGFEGDRTDGTLSGYARGVRPTRRREARCHLHDGCGSRKRDGKG